MGHFISLFSNARTFSMGLGWAGLFVSIPFAQNALKTFIKQVYNICERVVLTTSTYIYTFLPVFATLTRAEEIGTLIFLLFTTHTHPKAVSLHHSSYPPPNASLPALADHLDSRGKKCVCKCAALLVQQVVFLFIEAEKETPRNIAPPE